MKPTVDELVFRFTVIIFVIFIVALFLSTVVQAQWATRIAPEQIDTTKDISWATSTVTVSTLQVGSDVQLYRNAANMLRIADNIIVDGSVTLGGTSQFARLDVRASQAFDLGSSATGQDGIAISNPNATVGAGNIGGSISFSDLLSPGTRKAAVAAVQTTSDRDQVGLAFFTHPSQYTAPDMEEAVRITHDKRLGIGTTSPDEELHVAGSAVLDTSLVIGPRTTGIAPYPYADDLVIDTGGSSPGISLLMTSNKTGAIVFGTEKDSTSGEVKWSNPLAAMFIGSGTPGGALVLQTADQTERLRITSAGLVGIATADPSHILSIGAGQGNMIADGYDVNSERSLKADIVTAPTLSMLLARRPVLRAFRWKVGPEPTLSAFADDVIYEGTMPIVIRSATSKWREAHDRWERKVRAGVKIGFVADELPSFVRGEGGKNISLEKMLYWHEVRLQELESQIRALR